MNLKITCWVPFNTLEEAEQYIRSGDWISSVPDIYGDVATVYGEAEYAAVEGDEWVNAKIVVTVPLDFSPDDVGEEEFDNMLDDYADKSFDLFGTSAVLSIEA